MVNNFSGTCSGNTSKKVVTFLCATVASFIVALMALNFSLDFPQRYSSLDVQLRLNWLIKRLSHSPSPQEMVKSNYVEFTGEWGLVTYSMASAALTNIAMGSPQNAKYFSEFIARWIEWGISRPAYQFDEQAWGKAPLLEDVLSEDEGHIGYYGHLNFMLGCYALLNSDGRF